MAKLHVKQTASGAANGSTEADSISIATKNARTDSAGDIFFLHGTFTTAPVAHDSGSAGNLIWYVGDGMLTMGASPSWSGTTILPNFDCNGKSYIGLIGCEITQPTGTPSARCVNVASTTGCVITGNYIHNTYQNAVSDVGTGTASSKVTVRRNWCDDIGNNGLGTQVANGASGTIEIYGTQSLVEYNAITKSLDRTRPYGVKAIIRNNYWGPTDAYQYSGSTPYPNHIDGTQGFDFSGQPTQSQIIYERNYDTDNADSLGSPGPNGHGTIFQFVNGNYTFSHLIRRWNAVVRAGSTDAIYAGMTHVWDYNNLLVAPATAYTTVVGRTNLTIAAGSNNSITPQSNVDNLHVINTCTAFAPSITTGQGGIVCNSFITPTNSTYAYMHSYNSSGTHPGYPGTATNSLSHVDPLFTDGTGAIGHDDYRLTSGSPLKATGGPVTLANGSGSGSTTLIVNSAYGLFDGWGVADGDWIKIGSGAYVQITSINYATNTITLSAARTWSNGDTVYVRGMEDVGAIPYGGGDPAIASGSVTSLSGTATVTVTDAFNVRFVEILADGVPVGTSYSPSGNVFTVTWSGDGASHTFTAVAYGMWPSVIPAVKQAITYAGGGGGSGGARGGLAVVGGLATGL